MIRVAILATALSLSSGCCTLRAGSCDEQKYASGWTHSGRAAPPRCTDAVLAALDERPPCPAAVGLHGLVIWHEKPFMCGLGQQVWGCSTLGQSFVNVQVALPPNGHAADSALPEEVAHWVWAKCYPEVTLVEEWRKDPETGNTIYWRDPAFKAWYDAARGRAREICE